MTTQAITGAAIFDGSKLHHGKSLIIEAGRIAAILDHCPPEAEVTALQSGFLLPGLIDLQVNGGAGLMVGAKTDAAALAQICEAHLSLGTTGLMPTLITDRPEVTARVIEAGIAVKGHPGFLGLHLEGPHLDPRRAGAHDAALIRPMSEADCDALCAAASEFPLIVTLAPASVRADQISRLAAAGVVVSLGHAEATGAEVRAALAAGARMGTHLFNAMSPLGHREPGMVGTLLTSEARLGLIADGEHVRPEALRIALAARPEGIFLVTDAMAVAGTLADHFHIQDRKVLRAKGRLLLEDGTLAGADISLPQSIAYLVREIGLAPERAFAMASSIPAEAIGLSDSRGHIALGRAADLVHLDASLTLSAVWQQGQRRV